MAKQRRLRRRLTGLVVFSLACGVFFIACRGGLGATPYGAEDSTGRTMGFNDIFSAEHYGFILKNVSISGTIERMEIYEYVFVAAHAIAIGLLVFGRKQIDRQLILFFVIQPLIFPWGVLGLFFLPHYLRQGMALSLDRESFVDVPFIWLTAHSVWLVIAVFIAWRLHRSR